MSHHQDFYEQTYSLPSYQNLLVDGPAALYEAWQMVTWREVSPSGWYATLFQANYSIFDVLLVCLGSVFWTVLRILCTHTLFRKIVQKSGLKGKAASSVPESLWKLIFYLIAWSVSAYLVLVRYDLFFNPINTIKDWKIDSAVPSDIYWVYLGQASFYIHSIYATLFQDKWRKDSVVLLFHHIITILLISVSYMFRYTYLGLLVLFLHDFNDIFLESTKLALYYKSKGGKWEYACDLISSVGFLLFSSSWFLFRLYWFPLKVLYTTSHLSRKAYPDIVPPFYFGMNILLVFLFILHVYWFMFIVDMAYRVVSGKSRQLEDVRENDEQHKQKAQNNDLSNRNEVLKKAKDA